MSGRQKGSRAEREVAKLVQTWWAQFEPAAQFVRTPLSGGWGGPTLRGGFGAAGDLMTTSKTFPFVIEVKRREAWSWKTFLAGKSSPVWGWWEQAQTQALEMKRTPMLWIRRNLEKQWQILVPCQVDRRAHFEEGFRWTNTAELNVGIEPVMIRWDIFSRVPPEKFVVHRSNEAQGRGGSRKRQSAD